VHLGASSKPHVHNLIHEFLINMAFTMACPNFKKGLKTVYWPLGVKECLPKENFGDNLVPFCKAKKSPKCYFTYCLFIGCLFLDYFKT
jgi:hypothetical protein